MTRTLIDVLVALLALAVYLGTQTAEGVLVTSGTRLLAYFLTSCPTGWTDDNVDPYRGRVIKGTTTGFNQMKDTAITTQSNPVHDSSHGSGWSMTALLAGTATKTPTCNPGFFGLGTPKTDRAMPSSGNATLAGSQGTVSSSDSNMPSVTMNLCEFTTTTQTFSLPVGIVAFLAGTVSSCPTGWAAFSDGNGRFLVFGAANVDLSSTRTSPATAVTGSLGDIGTHTHALQSLTFTTQSICTTNSCGSGSAALAAARTLTLTAPTPAPSLGSSRVPIPYVQQVVCQVTDAATNNVLPPPDAVFFFNGNVCPALYRESTSRTDSPDNVNRPYSRIVGRLIYNKYSTESPGVSWGGTQFTHATSATAPPAGDAGHAGHTHSVQFSGYAFPDPRFKSDCGVTWGNCPVSGGSSPCNNAGFSRYDNYAFTVSTSTTSTSLVPYRIMRACSPQAPTSAPSKAPTTARPSRTPSKTPSIAPTTSFPTESPTIRPSRTPSKTPSRTPSKVPSRAPTTSTPTKSPTTPTTLTPTTNAPTSPPSPSAQPSKTPTTSSPSINPSLSPSTSVPSKSPTRAPAFESLCTGAGGDLDKFVTYENFFTAQASICAAQCRTSLLSGPTSNSAVQCVNNCNSFQGYSSNCMLCFQNYLSCQSTNCQTCFVASTTFLAKTCRDCATTKCRPALALCTGYSAEVMQVPTVAPTNPKDYVPPAVKEAISIAPIVGGVVGGFALMLAGAIFIQRRQMNDRIEGGLKQALEDRLFGKKDMVVDEDRIISQNAASDNPLASKSIMIDSDVEVRVPLRTRYSFHGDPHSDELDVAAGTALTGVGRNHAWWVALDESTRTVGLIPASFVSEM